MKKWNGKNTLTGAKHTSALETPPFMDDVVWTRVGDKMTTIKREPNIVYKMERGGRGGFAVFRHAPGKEKVCVAVRESRVSALKLVGALNDEVMK